MCRIQKNLTFHLYNNETFGHTHKVTHVTQSVMKMLEQQCIHVAYTVKLVQLTPEIAGTAEYTLDSQRSDNYMATSARNPV